MSQPHTRKLIGTLALSAATFCALGAATCTGESEVITSDGIRLATDYYHSSDQALPVIVSRTPYGRATLSEAGTALSSQGYALVAQDIRGTGDSEGTFMLFTDDGWGDNADGRETVEWALNQEWSTGQGCVWGASALGITSYLASGSSPQGLACGFIQVGTGDLFHHLTYQGGALREELILQWLDTQGYEEAQDFLLANPLETAPAYQGIDLKSRYQTVTTPIYHYGGWYDILSQGTLDAFEGLHNHGGYGAQGLQKLIMGPWNHAFTNGELVFPDSEYVAGEEFRWFDYWLKGIDTGIMDEPPVRYYMMGDPEDPSSPGNEWRNAENWPLPHSDLALYLTPGSGLEPTPWSGQDAASPLTSDPLDPVPTVGGSNLFLAAGAFEQSAVNNRDDVLLFESEPLASPLEIVGRIRAELFVSSTALDGDIAVKLMDIYPDGRSYIIQDGILRMRFREGQDQAVLMEPGEIYDIEVDLWSTAKVFNQGHRIGVSIAGSNSPRFEVNDHSGGLLPMDPLSGQVAEHTIFHDAAHPSRIILPVLAD